MRRSRRGHVNLPLLVVGTLVVIAGLVWMLKEAADMGIQP